MQSRSYNRNSMADVKLFFFLSSLFLFIFFILHCRFVYNTPPWAQREREKRVAAKEMIMAGQPVQVRAHFWH